MGRGSPWRRPGAKRPACQVRGPSGGPGDLTPGEGPLRCQPWAQRDEASGAWVLHLGGWAVRDTAPAGIPSSAESLPPCGRDGGLTLWIPGFRRLWGFWGGGGRCFPCAPRAVGEGRDVGAGGPPTMGPLDYELGEGPGLQDFSRERDGRPPRVCNVPMQEEP